MKRYGLLLSHQPACPAACARLRSAPCPDGLFAEEGQFSVIARTQLLGTFASYEDALKVGDQQCGLAPLMVKQIGAKEAVSFACLPHDTSCPA